MPKASKGSSKKTTRTKVKKEILKNEEESPSVEVQNSVEPVEAKSSIDVRLRKQQWDALDTFTKDRLGLSYEEFLTTEDVTGFGKNSYFTPPEERGLSSINLTSS